MGENAENKQPQETTGIDEKTLREIINEEIEAREKRYRTRIKDLTKGAFIIVPLAITALVFLIKYSGFGNDLYKKVITKGLAGKPAVSYQKTIVFQNEESPTDYIDFYAEESQSVSLELRVIPILGTSEDIDLELFINENRIDDKHYASVLKSPGSKKTINLTEHFKNEMKNQKVHTLTFQYEANGDLAKRITIKNLIIVYD